MSSGSNVSNPYSHRHVTDPTDIARVQSYLMSQFPLTHKLWSQIHSWQTQKSQGNIIEPKNVEIFISINPSVIPLNENDFSDLDAVLLLYGEGNTPDRLKMKRALLSDLRASQASNPSAPKLIRPPHDIFGAYHSRVGSDGLALTHLLRNCFPLDVCVMLTGIQSEFTQTVLEPLAVENRIGLTHNPHQQFLIDLNEGKQIPALDVQSPCSPTDFASPNSNAAVTPISTSVHASVASENDSAIGCNSSITIDSLLPEHASLVESTWPYRGPTTVYVMPWIIKNLPNRAVYVNGKPVCWALKQTYGGIGMLYTQPEHRGKGYALKCIHALTNAIQEANYTAAFAFISPNNIASQKTFHKVGFRPTHLVDWISWQPDVYELPKPHH
jgi:GNAT superfamily N-acetyltransferase